MFKLYFTYLYICSYLFIYLFIHLFICNLLLTAVLLSPPASTDRERLLFAGANGLYVNVDC